MKILLACLLVDDGPSTTSTAILVGFVVVMIVVVFAIAIRSRTSKSAPNLAPPEAAPSKPATFDDQMNAIAAQHNATWHYGTIAGVTYKNDDGGDRQNIVRGLHKHQQLVLLPEPDNPRDHRAIRVMTEDGVQVGYLPSRKGREVFSGLADGMEYLIIVAGIGQADTEDGNPGPWGVRIAIMEFGGNA